jgi:hypothetical protein
LAVARKTSPFIYFWLLTSDRREFYRLQEKALSVLGNFTLLKVAILNFISIVELATLKKC